MIVRKVYTFSLQVFPRAIPLFCNFFSFLHFTLGSFLWIEDIVLLMREISFSCVRIFYSMFIGIEHMFSLWDLSRTHLCLYYSWDNNLWHILQYLFLLHINYDLLVDYFLINIGSLLDTWQRPKNSIESHVLKLISAEHYWFGRIYFIGLNFAYMNNTSC